VPYLNSAYTKTVIPTKINEYLAMGKPVVSTPLPAVLELNHRHEEVVIVAQSRPESFIAALERALLSATDATMISCRRQVAALNNWQPRVEAMSLLIEKTVKEKRMALR
jgi:glycosyltransferase involved in cell wall biosynthesis